MSKITETTQKYLDGQLINQLFSPTLTELFRDYTPKWVNKELVWFKKTNVKKSQ